MCDEEDQQCVTSGEDRGDENNINNNNSNAAEAGVRLLEFSNDNLLKIDTGDKFSTPNAIKKVIVKQCPPPATGVPPEPLLKGMVRLGKNPKSPIVFLSFATAEDRAAARATLLGCSFRNKKWTEIEVTNADLNVTHKKGNKKRDRDAKGTGAQGVCPWSNVPYAEQLDRKRAHCLTILKQVCAKRVLQPKEGGGVVPLPPALQLFDDVITSPQKFWYRNNSNMSCGLDSAGNPAVGFNAGAFLDGTAAIEQVHPGFVICNPLVQLYADAVLRVSNGTSRKKLPDDIPLSSVGMYNKVTFTGFFRRVHVRNNKAFDVMVDLEVNTEAFLLQAAAAADGVSEEEKEKFAQKQLAHVMDVVLDEFKRIEEHRTTKAPSATATTHEADAAALVACDKSVEETLTPWLDALPEELKTKGQVQDDNDEAQLVVEPAAMLRDIVDRVRLVSLQYYVYNGRSTPPTDMPRTVAFGAPCLVEHLLGLGFDLSPSAFFQVNTLGMDAMLRKVNVLAKLDPKRTVLLDLCCGTGTIGLCLAGFVKDVVGVELVASAVENAKQNAARLGVKNATYVCGKIEDVIGSVLYNATKSDGEGLASRDVERDVVAILDPPRCGVHPNVMRELRNRSNINRIVYISCEQKALVRDSESLVKGSTSSFYGGKFDVTCAFGVDLFPHTPHVEMVGVFERCQQQREEQQKEQPEQVKDEEQEGK